MEASQPRLVCCEICLCENPDCIPSHSTLPLPPQHHHLAQAHGTRHTHASTSRRAFVDSRSHAPTPTPTPTPTRTRTLRIIRLAGPAPSVQSRQQYGYQKRRLKHRTDWDVVVAARRLCRNKVEGTADTISWASCEELRNLWIAE